MKAHKLCKKALDHPELFSEGELAYFNLWLTERKHRKEKKKAARRLKLEQDLLL